MRVLPAGVIRVELIGLELTLAYTLSICNGYLFAILQYSPMLVVMLSFPSRPHESPQRNLEVSHLSNLPLAVGTRLR